MRKIVLESTQTIVSEIDHIKLHRYILNAIGTEFAGMVENCYYPKVSKNSKLYKDLLYMTKSRESLLNRYSKEKYTGNKATYRLLHDPYTTLLILIVQDFLKNKDFSGAEATFHLFALRNYTNALYKMTTPRGSHQKICNVDYFQSALDRISKNHMFVKQKTIPNSIMYYSRAVMKKYMKALIEDDTDGLAAMIYELKSRIMQSMRGFFTKYYQARDEKDLIVKSKEEMDYDLTHEKKLRTFVGRIAKDMCVYGKIDSTASSNASSLIKFNKKLSVEYSKTLSNPMFSDDINTALFLLIKDIKDTSAIKTTAFLDHVQKMMAIKVTKKTVYFKRTISEIHKKVIEQLSLEDWYTQLSIQSKSISRNFIAYYLAFYTRNYI